MGLAYGAVHSRAVESCSRRFRVYCVAIEGTGGREALVSRYFRVEKGVAHREDLLEAHHITTAEGGISDRDADWQAKGNSRGLDGFQDLAWWL